MSASMLHIAVYLSLILAACVLAVILGLQQRDQYTPSVLQQRDKYTPVLQQRDKHTSVGIDATVYEAGIDFEIDHHRKWLCGKPCGFAGNFDGWFGYEKETKLKGEPVEPHRTRLCKLIAAYGDPTRFRLMLDHGAGPFTNLGRRFNCDFVGAPATVRALDAQVVAVDPLAPLYHGILTEFSVYNTQRTAYCPSESLTRCLGENTVDLSIIINALDHSRNAIIAWEEAVRVTRIGGFACVHTMKNEANHMANKGFHQWNFDVNADGAWLMSNSITKKTFDIDQTFAGILEPLDLKKAGILDHGLDGRSPHDPQFLKCYKKLTLVPKKHTRPEDVLA